MLGFRQIIDGCLETSIGTHGASSDFLNIYKSPLDEALAHLRKNYDEGTLPHYTLPFIRKDITEIESTAYRFRDEFSDVVVLGTGGSSLGGQTLCAFANQESPRLHFMDNVDPISFDNLFQKLKPCTTGFLVISKSGKTAETLAQFIICLEKWRENMCEHSLKDHFVVITEPQESPLKQLAQHYHIPCFNHDPSLGGRFSALSIVALLPFMIAGGDPLTVREGAGCFLKHILDAQSLETCPSAVGAALHVSLKNISQAVLMPYHDQWTLLAKWWRQLWGESLGKKNKGSTPIDALGTVDQHSQLQLYLDGPRDKFFTILATEKIGNNLFPFDESLVSIANTPYLQGQNLGKLLQAEREATYQTLVSTGCPTRLIMMEEISSYSLGQLMMHFMTETIFTAALLKVNPYDQPAVEAGKVLTQKILQGQS